MKNLYKILFIILIIVIICSSGFADETKSAEYWYERAKNTLDIDKKIEFFLKAIEIDNKFMEANRDLGIAYYQKNELEKSEEYLNKASTLVPRMDIKKDITEKKIEPQKKQSIETPQPEKRISVEKPLADSTLEDLVLIRKQLKYKMISGKKSYKKTGGSNFIDEDKSSLKRPSMLNSISNLFHTSSVSVPVENKETVQKEPVKEPVIQYVPEEEPNEELTAEPEENMVNEEVTEEEPAEVEKIEEPPLPAILKKSAEKKSQYNLNSVTATELKSIPGLTDVDAILITKYREQYGKYSKVEDLKNIPGFSGKYESVKDYFYIGEEEIPGDKSGVPTPKGLININKASVQMLQKGLGLTNLESLMIVRYREKYGEFKKKEDFKRVPLVGSLYNSLKDSISIK